MENVTIILLSKTANCKEHYIGIILELLLVREILEYCSSSPSGGTINILVIKEPSYFCRLIHHDNIWKKEIIVTLV